MMQKRVHQVPVGDTDGLRQRLVETWAEFQQSMVDAAIDQFAYSSLYVICLQNYQNWYKCLLELQLKYRRSFLNRA